MFEKMKTYYKVVIQKPDGLLVSTSDAHDNPFKIVYEPNKWISSTIGKIFVFGSSSAARLMFRQNEGCGTTYKIFKCECKKPIKPKFKSVPDLAFTIKKDIKWFWEYEDKNRILGVMRWAIPKSTYLCDVVKLTDEVVI
jgi:hypothetical protein